MKGLKSIGFRVIAMNVFEALKDRFGMGPEPMYYHQAKVKRIAAAAAYIAQKAFWKMPLRMSVIDIYNATLIYSAQPEKEEQYNGWINMIRERGIEISEIQEEVISGKTASIETDVIRIAEAMVEARYGATDKKEFYQILTANDEISDKIDKLVGVSTIKYWWEYEEMLQIEIESKLLLS